MNKIKQFFTRKRCKNLKLLNQKGFSLLEVLVAVSIIGVISAIAIPQFKNYKDNAAKVAADTSGSNIVKAVQNCLVLNGIDACDTLGEVGISCPSGASCIMATDSATPKTKLCSHIHTTSGSSTFNVCVELNLTNNTPSRKYGGTLLKNICHFTVTGCTNTAQNKEYSESPVKTCTQDNQCTGGAFTCDTQGGSAVIGTRKCKPSGHTGTCASGACG